MTVEKVLPTCEDSIGRKYSVNDNGANKDKPIPQPEAKGPSRMDIILYKLDALVSTRKGQSISLVILGLVLGFVCGVTYSFVNDSGRLDEGLWQAWTYMADPGTHAEAHSPGQRFVAFVITLIGILFFSVIMGFVVDGIRDKMDNLKKGKSKVIEEGHSLLLGWTDKSISLIKEICLANESEGGGTIVVLADEEKESLEAEIHSQIKSSEFLGTKVVLRTGSPLLSVDLIKVSASTARTIVIMAEHGDADKSDASTLRIVLSLKGLTELNGHIVAEVRDIDNEPLVRLVGGDSVETLVSHDVIGRLVLMSARSPGLAKVYSRVLGFDGDEFYLKEWPLCHGMTFSMLQQCFASAIPIGIQQNDGSIAIKPPMDRKIKPGENILVLAEDDDTYKAESPHEVDEGVLPKLKEEEKEMEKILMCGWRRDIRDMLILLDSMVLKGSEVHMVCEQPLNIRDKLLTENGLDINQLKNLVIIHHYGNTAVRRHMEVLPLHDYTSIMILADQERETDIMHSDSHSLATLLLLRDLQSRTKAMIRKRLFSTCVANKIDDWNKAKDQKCMCICEILDPRTQKTISSNSAVSLKSDFVQSNELISRILAMISESREVRGILDELLGADGCSFSVEPSSRYCSKEEIISFYQLSKRAQKLNEVLCGYQFHGSLDNTVLNPPDKSILKSWQGYDLVVINGTSEKEDGAEIHGVCEAFEEGARRRRAKQFSNWQAQKAQLLQTCISAGGDPQEIEEFVTSIDKKILDESISSPIQFNTFKLEALQEYLKALDETQQDGLVSLLESFAFTIKEQTSKIKKTTSIPKIDHKFNAE